VGVQWIMDKIKVIKNSISPSDAQLIIDYIDSNIDSFIHNKSEKRFHKMFGIDSYHGDKCKPFIDTLDGIETMVKELVDVIKRRVMDEFEENEDIFLSSIWFTKGLPGAIVSEHIDIDDGSNSHFFYSAVLYLNTIDDGVLEFPKLNISVKPELADLVVFTSIGEDMLHGVSSISQDRYTVPMWFTKDRSFEVPFI